MVKKVNKKSQAASERGYQGHPIRANRLPEEAQAQFKSRRDQPSTGAIAPNKYRSSDRFDQKPKDNVNLSLSPRLLDLAEEMASDRRMSLREYLTEALRFVILLHGERLGMNSRHIAEFQSQNRRKVSTWKVDSQRADSYTRHRDQNATVKGEPAQESGSRYRHTKDRPIGGTIARVQRFQGQNQQYKRGQSRPQQSERQSDRRRGSEKQGYQGQNPKYSSHKKFDGKRPGGTSKPSFQGAFKARARSKRDS